MFIRHGFPGQRLQVLPGPLVESALAQAPTSLLLTTDAGYFPRASHHGRRRVHGARQAIVIVCTAGAGWCESGGRRIGVRRDQALVIGPGVPHLYYADETDPWTIWWVHVAGQAVGPFMARLGADEVPRRVDLTATAALTNEIAGIVVTMESEASQPSLAQTATHAWTLLTRLVLDRTGAAEQQAGPIALARQHLHDHLTEPVRVPDLARRAGLSVSHFSALFRAATGTSVVDYVTRLRMARARELLLVSTQSVTEVAAAVGFADPFYFARRFRRIHGCSPTQFRQSRRDDL